MVLASKMLGQTEADEPDFDFDNECIYFEHEQQHDTCTCHSLQLVIKDLLKDGEVKPLITRQFNIAKKFRKSTVWWNALRSEQEKFMKPNDPTTKPRRPVVYAEVRWNSVRHMLKRNIELRPFYDSLKTSDVDKKVSKLLYEGIEEESTFPKQNDWKVVKDICRTLTLLR